ncbi:MAG: hypothetical protein WCS34_06455 [Bacteroidales bacterium]
MINKHIFHNLPIIFKYNFKIIFSGKFFWYVIASVAIFLGLLYIVAASGQDLNTSLVFRQILVPAILLIFYPTVFGIQNDADSKILEILFGIPNYRYKIWGVRLLMIYAIAIILVLFLSYIAIIFLYPINPFSMTFNVIFPLLLVGNMAFMFSTLVKNGNGAAIITIFSVILLLIFSSGALETSQWNVFLNPYGEYTKIHPMIWHNTIIKNKIILLVASIIFSLTGLLKLQKRESFI